MFENIANFFKKLIKTETKETPSKDTAKERLHLVLMQDRANVSADFLELMKQEIIEVIKKYIEVEESAIDVRLTNEVGEDGKQGAPSLYANIPILNIKNNIKRENTDNKQEEKTEGSKEKKEQIEEIKEEKLEDNKEDKKEEIEKVENKDIEETEENKEIKEEAKKDNKQEVESDTHSDPQHEPEKKENKNVVNKKTTNSKNSKKNK